MDQGIALKIITFPATWEGNPLPYAPAFIAWNEHIGQCAPCGRVDQLAKAGAEFDPRELCEGGAVLQFTVSRRIDQQYKISLQN
jgi:hypothetical protein